MGPSQRTGKHRRSVDSTFTKTFSPRRRRQRPTPGGAPARENSSSVWASADDKLAQDTAMGWLHQTFVLPSALGIGT